MFREGFDMSETLLNVRGTSLKYTPLQFLVYNSKIRIVQFLLERNVNPNVGGINGDTPLIISIKNSSDEITKKLLLAGANTCKPDKNGKTPLYWAVTTKNVTIIYLLLDHGAELTVHTALLHAIRSDYLDIVKLLVRRGAPVNVMSPETPLTAAIIRRHLDIAKFLIESGANVNLADGNGNLPVKMCLEQHNFKIINCMVANGLKVDATLANTLLVWSLEKEKVNLVKHFIENGADINQKHKNGQTLLSIALKNSDLQSFRLLIESGADPRLAEAEIKEKMTKDSDFAIYVKSSDLKSKMKKPTIRGN
jgi:ankyrin repeat protein